MLICSATLSTIGNFLCVYFKSNIFMLPPGLYIWYKLAIQSTATDSRILRNDTSIQGSVAARAISYAYWLHAPNLRRSTRQEYVLPVQKSPKTKMKGHYKSIFSHLSSTKRSRIWCVCDVVQVCVNAFACFSAPTYTSRIRCKLNANRHIIWRCDEHSGSFGVVLNEYVQQLPLRESCQMMRFICGVHMWHIVHMCDGVCMLGQPTNLLKLEYARRYSPCTLYS